MRNLFAGAVGVAGMILSAGAHAQWINVTNEIDTASFRITAYAHDDAVRWISCAQLRVAEAPAGGTTMQSLNPDTARECTFLFGGKLGLDLKITIENGAGDSWCEDVSWGSTVKIRFEPSATPQWRCQR